MNIYIEVNIKMCLKVSYMLICDLKVTLHKKHVTPLESEAKTAELVERFLVYG